MSTVIEPPVTQVEKNLEEVETVCLRRSDPLSSDEFLPFHHRHLSVVDDRHDRDLLPTGCFSKIAFEVAVATGENKNFG